MNKHNETDPYSIIGDLHTHTVASQHAYSTIQELITASIGKGYSVLAVTDHGPEMMDGAISHHFLCLNGLPCEVSGVRLLKGAEVNIKDYQGRLDLDAKILAHLDFVIASYHVEAIEPGTTEQITQGWLSAVRNPLVDCIGHPGNPKYPFDHEAVVRELAMQGKLMEVNANSFVVRPGSERNCRDLVSLCMEYQVPVVVNSDAHSLWQVGDVALAVDLLKSLSFPPHMILNTSHQAISDFVQARKARKLQHLAEQVQ